MSLEYALSKRGVRKLVDNGSMFVKDGQFEDRIMWKCDLFNSSQCKARVHTVGEVIVKRSGEHNHAGNAARVEVAKMMEQILLRAQTTSDSADAIVNEAIATLNPASMCQLTNLRNIKRVVQRCRSKREHLPPLPDATEDFVIADEFLTTEGGQQFLLADCEQDTNRILIFSTEKNLELLSRCETWFVNGTFTATLQLFNKVYVILGLFGDIVVPLVYSLMLRESEEAYKFIFSKLKELEPMLKPKTIFSDFEINSFGAICKSFGEIMHHGCFFQFCQIFFKSIQMADLQQKFESDAELALKLKLLPALAFICSDDVVKVFEMLSVCTKFPEEALPLIDYFEDSWIGKIMFGKVRQSTIFPITFWNCADITDFNVVKINYIFETWHRGFTNQINFNGTNIWKFLKFIRSNQAKSEATLNNIELEDETTKVRLRNQTKKLETVVLKHDKSNCLDYLNAISSSLFF